MEGNEKPLAPDPLLEQGFNLTLSEFFVDFLVFLTNITFSVSANS
jgi:hypothetical protein